MAALLNPLIQRLKNTGIHCGDNIHRRVQFLLRHPRLPCIRKAPLDSGVTQPHHRNGQADEHLLSLAETFNGMSVTIECSEISFLQNVTLRFFPNSKPETRHPKPVRLLRPHPTDQSIGKTAFDVDVVVVAVPREVILLQSSRQFWCFGF